MNHRQLAERNLSKAHSQVEHIEACKRRGEPSDEGAEAIAVARSSMGLAHALLADNETRSQKEGD